MVKLYKEIDGKIKLVDYGVSSKADDYVAQGYIVEFVIHESGKKWR